MRLSPAALTVFLVASVALPAQEQPRAMLFQEAQSLPIARGGITVIPLPRVEKGKPFSATATTEVERTLLDGTHVSQTTTSFEYRDAEGRLRIERWGRGSPVGPPRSITIRDPLGGFTCQLDPVRKTAVKTNYQYAQQDPVSGTIGAGGRGSISGPDGEARGATEDLGIAVLAGVSAHGTRVTIVVPAHAIGNDREFRSTNERWFSSELDLLIKSVSVDPRFGTTTFVRTNIRRSITDPSLFQVPADYKVVAEPNH